jgi:hypothetical protein
VAGCLVRNLAGSLRFGRWWKFDQDYLVVDVVRGCCHAAESEVADFVPIECGV